MLTLKPKLKKQSSVQTLFSTAQQFYQQGKFQAAIERLDTLVNKQTTFSGLWQVEAYHQLACCHALLSLTTSTHNPYAAQAKNYFERALKQKDVSLSGLEQRIRCDYSSFLYQQKDYQKAYEHAQIILQSADKSKWLRYTTVEQAILPKAIQEALIRLTADKLTHRALAYYLSLSCLESQRQLTLYSTLLSDFVGETYQGIDPLAFELLAQHHQQQGETAQANKAHDYSRWTKTELQAVELIKTLQAVITRRALPTPVTQNEVDEGSCDTSEPMLYARLAQVFEGMGDIYLNKQSYTKAAGLYAMAARIKQSLVGSGAHALDKKRAAVEQALITSYLPNNVALPTFDTWKKQQVSYHRQLAAIRHQARQALQERWQPFSKKPEEAQVEKTEAIQAIFADITQGMQALIKNMLQDCYSVSGPPPCGYAVIGLGSLARQEMTPYSDLEWAIVIEEDNAENRRYFQQLAALVSVKITSLAETILPALAIESLNPEFTESSWAFFDDIIPRGFAVDGAMAEACKTPQGKKDRRGTSVFALLGTPEQFADYLSYDSETKCYWFERHQAMTLPTVLMNAVLLEGDASVFERYRNRLKQALHHLPSNSRQPLYQYLMHKLLDGNLKAFVPNAGEDGQLFDAKKSFYRIPNLIIDELALYYGLDLAQCSGVAKVTALEKMQGLIQPAAAQRLRYVLSETLRFRLQTYLHYGAQGEAMNPLQQVLLPEDSKAATYHAINTQDLACIEYSLQVLLPLYKAMQVFQQAPESGRDLLYKMDLFDDSLMTQGRIALRLHQLDRAKTAFEQALALEEKNEHTMDRLGYIYNQLGCIEYKLGYAEKSLDYYRLSLTISKQLYTEQHPAVTASLNNIGLAYVNLRSANQALNYLEQALTINKQWHGEQHPNIAATLNNIGLAYADLGDTKRALTCFEQALTILKLFYGEQHPEVATTLSNIGSFYADLSEAKQTLRCCSEAFILLKKLYGEQHPNVATSLNSMGRAYEDLGDAQQALCYYKQALTIRVRLYGEQSPDVAVVLSNMGSAYKNLGEAKQALNYYQQALTIRIRRYGEQSPSLALTLNNMGLTYADLGNTEQARSCYQQALTISQQCYGKQHPYVALALNNIGLFFADSGDSEQALVYFNQALSIQKRLYGESHLDIATSLNNIGTVYTNRGDTKRALTYLELALDILKQLYGERHPHVARSLNNIGLAYAELSKTNEALTYLNRAFILMKQLYGDQHPHVLVIYNSITRLSSTQKQTVSPSFSFPNDMDVGCMAGSKHGFFNGAPKSFFKFDACYAIEQSKSNTIEWLNELTGLAFVGYFRIKQNFVLDAVLTCSDKQQCAVYEKKLKQYEVEYDRKSGDDSTYYLVVADVNSIQISNKLKCTRWGH